MTEFVTLWSPPGSEAPRQALEWLDDRSRIDRILVPFMDGFDPQAQLPLGAYTFESYLRLADERGRRMLVVPDVLDPGTSDYQRGGVGYHHNKPDITLKSYKSNLKKLVCCIGDRVDLVWGAQAGNEQDWAPEMQAPAQWKRWTNFQLSCLEILCETFHDAHIVGGGMELVKYGGDPVLAEAIYDQFGKSVILDTHWNNGEVDDCRDVVQLFVESHPEARIGCFENNGMAKKQDYANLAKELGLVAYADFNGMFPCEKWGNSNPQDTSDLAVENRKGGAWVWSKPNALATTRAAKVLGALRTSSTQTVAQVDEIALEEEVDFPTAGPDGPLR